MFAELVCGPPGSGKSTYCEGKRQFLSVYDPCRPVIVFNLDPANDGIFPYPCDVNICELVSHKETMEATQLGPNGSYLYCSDFIGENLDWVKSEIEKYAVAKQHEITTQYPASQGFPTRAPYVLIDCPGQVEFYLHADPMLKLIKMLQKQLQCDLCVVHLTDAGVATRDVPTYVATCLLSLSVMVDMELPHVNVLTKWETVDPIVPCKDDSSSSSDDKKKRNKGGSDDDSDISDDVVGDENEYFLQPSDLFSNHLSRMWRLKDNRKLKEEELLWRRRERALVKEEEEAQKKTDSVATTTATGASATAAAPSAAAIHRRRPPHFTSSRLFKLSEQIANVVEGYGLVAFEPLAIQDQQMMVRLTQKIDNAMGNLF